jgi:hypothetical protein
MYYVIKSVSNDAGYKMSFSYRPDFRGRAFDEGVKFTDDQNELPHLQHPKSPIQVKIRDDDKNNPWPSFISVPVPFLSKHMYEVLLAAGVNNIDVYPVEISHPDGTIAPESDNYYVFNLLGTVAAVDLAKTVYDPNTQVASMITMSFDSLAIDKAKAKGHLMFRLAESITTILVHESVKTALEEANIPLIEFYETEHFAAL